MYGSCLITRVLAHKRVDAVRQRKQRRVDLGAILQCLPNILRLRGSL
jgi:hypothetical protein